VTKELNYFEVVVTVDYLDGSGGQLPFYVPATCSKSAVEKTRKAVRELYEGVRFVVEGIEVRPVDKWGQPCLRADDRPTAHRIRKG